MKPFFEAGLKDLATASGYPTHSIQSCSNFKRIHHFLIEAWESLYRHMLKQFLLYREHAPSLNYPDDLNHVLEHTLQEFENYQDDSLAIYSIIQSFIDGTTGLEVIFFLSFIEMSNQDDTWKFWSRFILEDCKPYIALFVKLMAANFSAFDHYYTKNLLLITY